MDARRWMVVVGLLMLLSAFGAHAGTQLQWTAAPIGPAGKPMGRGVPDGTAALDAAGNLYVVGRYCADPTPNQPCENDGMILIKYAADTGQELWRFAQVHGPFGSALNSVALDAAGNVYVTGFGTPTMDVTQYVAKFTADGTLLWQVDGAPGQSSTPDNSGVSVQVDRAGNPYVLAVRERVTIVTRYAPADGSVVWSSAPSYDAPTDQVPLSFRVDPDANLVGATFAGSGSRLFKLNGATGERMWQTVLPYTLPGPDNPLTMRAFELDGAGKALIGGSDISKWSNVDGSQIWERRFDACCAEATVWGVAALSNGDVIAVGDVTGPRVARLASASGDTVWQTDIVGGPTSQGTLRAVQVAASDTIVIGGIKKYDYGNATLTLTMNPDTHAIGMLGRFTESVGEDDPQKVLLSPDGVFNVGQITGISGSTPVRILKYVQAASTASAQRFDLNGDGNADLVFQHADGSIEVRLMQGTTVIGSSTFVPSAPGHIVGTTGDFNGDGKSDLLYARNDGAVEMWLMDGTALTNITTIMPAGYGWSVAHVGDFNGDGKSDLLWQNTNGAVGMWLMEGSTASAHATIMPAGYGWSPALVGDFDGDGKSDIVWRNTDGSVSMWLMNGTTTVDRGPLLGRGSSLYPLQVGDFNGDGRSDLLFQDSADGSVQMWLMNGRTSTSTATVMPANGSWTVTQVADFNGDGMADLIWTARDGTVGMWLMNGTSLVQHQTEMPAGSGWSVSVAEDLSGDGESDLVWSQSSGAVGAWIMNGTSQRSRSPLEPAGSTHRVVPVQFHH